MKNLLQHSEGEKDRRNGNVKEMDEERCRTEFIKVLKAGYTGMPDGFEDWSFEQLKDWAMNTGSEVNKFTKSLAYLMPALARPIDSGRSAIEKPEWLDLDLFRRGQKFGMENFFSITCANVFALCMAFTDKEILKTLILTGRSDTPYRAFKRYLGTVNSERNWYTGDPWEKGTPAYKDMAIVRGYHKSITNRLRNTSREKIETDSKISEPWSSIRDIFVKDSNTAVPPNPNLYDISTSVKYRTTGINQAEMSVTQFTIVAFIITYPEAFGVYNADEANLEAFCHYWRSIGYLLGIEDDYNFCRGSLREIKQRSKDALDLVMIPGFRSANAEWEHMSRCLVDGVNYFAPFPSYEVAVLFMTDLLKLPMPRLLASVDYITRIKLAFTKFFFYYIVRIPGVRQIANILLHKCIDKALAFSPKELSALEEKSRKTLLDFTLG